MKISGIVVPLIKSEFCHLKTWLRYCPSSGEIGKTIFLSIDQEWNDLEKADVLDTYSRSALIQENWLVKFIDCRMTSEESFYIKDPKTPLDTEKYPYGQKSGPNLQFFRTMRALEVNRHETGAILLMEVDAFPIDEGWLNSLNEELRDVPDDVLIAGSRYAGTSNLANQIRSHLNGNSVYFVGRSDFYSFLCGWERLLLHGNKIVPHLAYDTVIPWYSNYKTTHKRVGALENSESSFVESCFNTRTYDISTILINYGGPDENAQDYTLDVTKFLTLFPRALIAHGKCFNEPIFKLRAAKKGTKRKVLVNILTDLVRQGNYENAVLFGLGSIDMVKLITARTDKLSDSQVRLLNRNLNHEPN